MLLRQAHHAAMRRHQICPYLYTCTAVILANCLLHQIDKVDVDKALRLCVNVPCMRAQCLLVSIMRACPAPSCSCLAHTCTKVLFARGYHASFVCTDLKSRIFAYGLLGGCAHASLNMWVYAYLYCAIYSKCWALISCSGICLPA